MQFFLGENIMPKKKENKSVKATRVKVTKSKRLFDDIRRMIDNARSSVAVTINVGLTMLYWRIGKRVNDEILKNK